MTQLNATPYLSELKEQNALIREQNRSLDAQNQILDAQNEIFKTFLKTTSPSDSSEGHDIFTILKSLYSNGAKLHTLLSSRGVGSVKRGTTVQRLEQVQGLSRQLKTGIDKLSELLPPTNYFHRDYTENTSIVMAQASTKTCAGINHFLYYQVCKSTIDKWQSWDMTNAGALAQEMSRCYDEFLKMSVGQVLGSPESWGIAG